MSIYETGDEDIPDEEEFDELNDGGDDEVTPEEEALFQQQMNDLTAFNRAEQDEFNSTHADFVEKYGFTHDCHCAEDWDEGNLGVVSMCYLGMATDAMNTLAETRLEIREVRKENARLLIELADAGSPA